MKVSMQVIIEKEEDFIELSYEEGKKLYEELKKLYEKDEGFCPMPWKPLKNPWKPTVTYRFKNNDAV